MKETEQSKDLGVILEWQALVENVIYLFEFTTGAKLRDRVTVSCQKVCVCMEKV
jgi:hypothetical protein